jgi:hypothetical protein
MSKQNNIQFLDDWRRLGHWRRFKFENRTMSHVRGMLLLGSPPSKKLTFKPAKPGKVERYVVLLNVLTKSKVKVPALELVTTLEPVGSTPALIILRNPVKNFVVAIQKSFYDIITLKWPDVQFIAAYPNRFIYAYTPNGENHLNNRWVAFMRSFNISID